MPQIAGDSASTLAQANSEQYDTHRPSDYPENVIGPDRGGRLRGHHGHVYAV